MADAVRKLKPRKQARLVEVICTTNVFYEDLANLLQGINWKIIGNSETHYELVSYFCMEIKRDIGRKSRFFSHTPCIRRRP